MAKSTKMFGENQMNLKTLTFGDLTWVDIVQPTNEAANYLSKHYNFNPLDLEDALSPRQVAKIEEYRGYMFVIFNLSVYDKASQTSSRKQWSAFLGTNFLVTLRPPELKAAGELFRECEIKKEACEQYLNQGAGYLLYNILDQATDRYFKVLDKILRRMDDIENAVFSERIEVVDQLNNLRRDIINQKQVMLPTRVLLEELESKLKQFSKKDLTLHFSDLMDHVNKICNTLDEYAQVIEVFKDSDYLLSSYRANRTVRALAVLLAIGLPFFIVGSIYLMLHEYLGKGSLQTSLIMLLIIIVFIGTTLFLLRRKRLI